MLHPRFAAGFSRLFRHYGMLGVLLMLCLFFSWATLKRQVLVGEDAGQELAAQIARSADQNTRVLILAGDHAEGVSFAAALTRGLEGRKITVVKQITGTPPEARKAVEKLDSYSQPITVVAAQRSLRLLARDLQHDLPALANVKIVTPESFYWPTFLLPSNLLNVANQIVVIAVIAVGMTMVIITGGIDLSVGSLVALSAVVTATLILRGGGLQATGPVMVLASLAAIGACAAVGAFSGAMITLFRIPPFIATLAMMQVASGLAYIVSHGGSIYQIPVSFTWLGRGTDLLSIPNTVLLMAGIYALAHVVMKRTRLGRHIYAVGGNRQAARLSGLRVNRVLLVVYIVSGAMAGLGGVIEASQLKSGSPTYGLMYELYVIAAVVVGGTSLSGGEGRILGTLIGALIIGVIQNGMNLTEVESYTQKVVLGLVILGAVLLDMLKKQGWRGLAKAE